MSLDKAPKLDTVTVKMNFAEDYAFEKKVVKDTKLGQNVYLHIPISDTHEVKITSRVVSKRKVRRK